MKKNKKIKCYCCKEKYSFKEISFPETKDKKIKKVSLCQDCLAGVMSGEIKLDLDKLFNN